MQITNQIFNLVFLCESLIKLSKPRESHLDQDPYHTLNQIRTTRETRFINMLVNPATTCMDSPGKP